MSENKNISEDGSPKIVESVMSSPCDSQKKTDKSGPPSKKIDTPNEYDENIKRNIADRNAKLQSMNIIKLPDLEKKKREILVHPPKVFRVIEASNMTTRQQQKKTIEMIGELDDIEGKTLADNKMRLAQNELERTKRREEIKRKNNWGLDSSDE